MTDDATAELLDAGRGYEALHVPALFAPWPPFVLDAARVGEGDSVLDVACGTGVLARAALARVGEGGAVVGVDLAPGMLAAAAEIEPDVDWRLGAAEDLPAEDGAFDAVVSQFGVMFFSDRDQAAREFHRVTRPGGRTAIAAWDDVAKNPAYTTVIDVLHRHVGPEAADTVRAPFALSDPAETVGPLEKAGFTDIEVAYRTSATNFPDARVMMEAELRGWLPIFGIMLDEERIAHVLAKAEEALAPHIDPSGRIVSPTSAFILSAARP